MKVLCIIVSYNFMPWAERCLGSLAQSATPCDVMVVDNGSADGTPDYLREHHPDVMLIENHRNLGFGRANNIGLEYALGQQYDGVLLLNQDAWIDPDTLGRLAAVAASHQEMGVVSPVHLTAARNAADKGFSVYTGITDLERQPQADVVAVPFVNAAIWYVPIATLKRVGLFAPLFYHYGEDVDYVNRVAYHGLSVGYVPRCYGVHDRAMRQPTRSGFFRSEATYHLAEYANINYSFPKAFAMGVLAIVKKAAQSALRRKWGDAREYISMACRWAMRTPEVVATRRNSKRKYARL